MANASLVDRMALGATAGLGATVAMQGMRTASQKLAPSAQAPIREDPGGFMVKQAASKLPDESRQRIPEAATSAASSLLHFGYGATAGVLYGALQHGSPDVWRDGLLLGLGVWAAGYLGWLPGTGLMPPVTEQRPAQVLVPVLQHIFFGVVAVEAFALLERRLTGER
jgi:hypothetical protein